VARAQKAWPAAEKKSLHATERDTEENLRRREAFLDRIAQVAPEDLIYLDESGVNTQMTRLYGRAERGRRVHDSVPGGHWKMLTILGAMDHNGMMAAMTVEAATDREIFLAFLDEVLCPKLRAGHIVIMDNLSAHKVDGVRERIEACGASLLYLPPYSPDLNPIEKAWSKLKQTLRAVPARTVDALHQAVADQLPNISAQDASNWFHLRFGLHL
jgi:transposase